MFPSLNEGNRGIAMLFNELSNKVNYSFKVFVELSLLLSMHVCIYVRVSGCNAQGNQKRASDTLRQSDSCKPTQRQKA